MLSARDDSSTMSTRDSKKNHWSLDACVGRALAEGLFGREDIVCTKTLYNYVTMGLLGKIKSIDLPLRVRRKNKKKHTQERKKKLGRSIEERDPSIEERKEFGHWECDLVLGAQSKDEVLLTLVERKTRRAMLRKLRNKESTTVLEAFRKLRQEEMFKDCFDQVFRTLTTDNGSEFARLSELEEMNAVRVYYAHPYCSCEKGTNENHSGLFRRFLPKGKRMEDYPAGHIARVEEWANTLPRKILGYSAPEECFEKDVYLCSEGRKLVVSGIRHAKSRTGFVSEKTCYTCKSCKDCPRKADCIHGNHSKQPLDERTKHFEVAKVFQQERQEDLARITSEHGIELRVNRSIQAEGAFADVKTDRNYRRFLTKGHVNVEAETILLAMAHNIFKEPLIK